MILSWIIFIGEHVSFYHVLFNAMSLVINSYIPGKVVSAIVFPDRAWRALREVQVKFRGYSNG